MNTSEWEQSIDIRVDNSNDDQATDSILQYPSLELPSAGRIGEAEAIINKVMEVAESNQTIERILERRHEVKDVATKGSHAQQHRDSLAEALASHQESSSMPMPNHEQAVARTPLRPAFFKRLLVTNSLCGYAIRYGFLSALLALLIAVIAVNLFT